ncbi:MAG: class I SAM-dependent methyltransferase [Proteobacteria bacterium]|nr:class I SAM-dependent methyltransferase [Pseudomonadota bacterium]
MEMIFNSPLSKAKSRNLIDLLGLSADSRILDVGCGTGEFLIQIAERYECEGIGVDIESKNILQAQKSVLNRIPHSKLKFLTTDVSKFEAAQESFDCCVCIGSTHAFSSGEPAYCETLKGLSKLVKINGLILVGEGYWKRPPVRDYLDFIGEPVGVYRSHLENVELASQFGLNPLYATTSNDDEWDDFEWKHRIRKEMDAVDSGNEQKQKALNFTREWTRAYLRWGRGTMGFGFYLFSKIR